MGDASQVDTGAAPATAAQAAPPAQPLSAVRAEREARADAEIEAPREDAPDRYTAPADALPRRREGATTLADCVRGFARQPSPPYLAGAVVIAAALRIVQGHFSWRDAVMAVGLVAITPFVEWAIH